MHERFVAQSLYASNGARKYLTAQERARFLAVASQLPRPALRTFCLTLAHTGCRISEALSITGRAFDRDDGFIALRSLKKRGNAIIMRDVPMPDGLLADITTVHGIVDNRDRVLWPWCRSHAWAMIKQVMIQASINDGAHATAKGLRHAFGIHALRSGVPITLVQRWLGHANLATTSIYLQVMGPEERLFAERMWLS